MLLDQLKKSSVYIRPFFVILLCMLILIFSRTLSYIPNFTPTLSLIIFLSFLIRDKYLAVFIVITSLLVTDFILGFYSSMIFVYSAYIIVCLISYVFLNHRNLKNVIKLSISSELLFYLITNFGVWMMTNTYTSDIHGLYQSYIAAIPFLKLSLGSTLIYSVTIYMIFKIIFPGYLRNDGKVHIKSN